MDIRGYSPKDIGVLGEKVAAEFLRRQGFTIQAINVRVTFGELDIVALREDCLHVVEVKSLKCAEFPDPTTIDQYGPGENLHQTKIRKIVRTARWYIDAIHWEGDWQIDAALIWLREIDGMAHIRYFPQIL